MAKFQKEKQKLTSHSKNDPKAKRRTYVFVVLLAVVSILIYRHLSKLQKYEQLSEFPNQACVGIGVALENGLTFTSHDIDAKSLLPFNNFGSIGQHKCNIKKVVTSQKSYPDGSSESSGYELGADVLYFKSPDAAYEYAESFENKNYSWGVDEEGQRNGIPQTSLFTYIFADTAEPYFEAYTVQISKDCPLTESAFTNFDNNTSEIEMFARIILTQNF
jgi:hypothetical protein